MQIIKTIEELIEDEINDQKHYAKLASKVKQEHPMLAQVLYNISTQEEGHAAALHNEAVKLIEQYRKEHGAPPPAMQAVYDYLHEKHMEKAAEARHYQEIYKNT
jgi:hypothetical protein